MITKFGGSSQGRQNEKGGNYNVENTYYGARKDVPYYPLPKDFLFQQGAKQGIQGQESSSETNGGQGKGQSQSNSNKEQKHNDD